MNQRYIKIENMSGRVKPNNKISQYLGIISCPVVLYNSHYCKKVF